MRRIVHPETIDLIVQDYRSWEPERLAESTFWKGDGMSFSAITARAVLSEVNGRRHPHQRRLSNNALVAGAKALRKIETRIKSVRRFHELHVLIEGAFKPIRGLGELAAYDTADRIRHRLGLESEHVIYLHAGARVGARRLAGGRLPRESAWGMLKREFPQGLRQLSTHEIEDVLCIYKDDFFVPPHEFRSRRPCCWFPVC